MKNNNATLRRGCRRIPGGSHLSFVLIAGALLLIANPLFSQVVGILGPTNVTTLNGGWYNNGQYGPYSGYQSSQTGTNTASFNFPAGLALEPSGNSLFIADCSNNAVRWISNVQNPGAGTWVYSFLYTNDGVSLPVALAVDGATNIYVLNRARGTNGYILEYNAVEFMQFPQPGTETFVQTNATHLTNATAMAIDGLANLYVTCNSNTILRITPADVVSTVGVLTNAGVNLLGVAVQNNNQLALSDAGNNGIWLLNLTNGIFSKLTGFHGAGDTPGPSSIASFNNPENIAAAGQGWLVVADRYNHKVKTIDPSGSVYRLFGVKSNDWDSCLSCNPFYLSGLLDGLVDNYETNYSVMARQPYAIAVAPDGSVYDTEVYYDVVRHATFTGLPPLPPAAPTSMSATANYGYVYLTWTASTGATNYIIERGTSNVGPFSTIANTISTFYTDTNVNDGTTYYYVIQAQNSSGTGPIQAFSTSATPLFSPPPIILSVFTNYGEVILNWSVSAGATSYNLQRSYSSGGPYTLIANTTATRYTDTNVLDGTTYYYVLSAVNSGGVSTNSIQVSATVPIPPPPSPEIGWFDYEGNTLTGFFTLLHPISGAPYVTYNDLNLAIYPDTFGAATYYITGASPLSGTPSATNGTSPPYYDNDLNYAEPLPVTTVPDMVIEAVNVNGVGAASSIATAEILYEVANPTIIGNNAAAFTISDITTNAVFWYTTDGSDPTNNALSTSVGPISSTNNSPVTISLNGSSNILFQVRAYRNGYSPSGIAVQSFSPSNYVPNTISFGFQYGPGSSHLVASPGQFFMAPVALSLISASTIIESMQFAVTATNIMGSDPVNPAAGFSFSSMLYEPDPQNASIYVQIPTWGFVTTNVTPPSYDTNLIFSTFYGSDPNGSWFQNMQFTNDSENLLGVGWLELHGRANLYPTLSQELISYSLFGYNVSGWENLYSPPNVILGGYSFAIPPNATSNDVYQIQIIRPSASGYPDGAVYIDAPTNTDPASLGYGTLNAIKNVTIGQLKYIVGDVYPAPWYNAGDFGSTNLANIDVQLVFNAAIYDLNTPISPSTDLYDALDSCGNFGTYDSDPADVNYGYYTNNNAAANINPVSTNGFTANTDLNDVQLNGLFNGNDTNINQICFGDGVLDVCDVYVTYRRSLDPSLAWYQRFWNNGHRVAQAVPNQVVNTAGLKQPAGKQSAGIQFADTTLNSGPISITNMPSVIFTAGDYLATPGQQISIPITASVFGQYPLRVAMLNISVVPLDGSPALTTPISFTPGAALGSPLMITSDATNNYAAVWLDSTIIGISNSGTIGTLTITIPANATSMSSYGIHFDHASGSPNGLASFPKTTYTGLITLSSRTNSYYNDGIPDSWRLRYFGTIYNLLSVSNADADGTPFNNWQKYIAGLNPTDPTSVLAAGLDQPMATQTNDCVIDWPSVNGVQYVIQRSPTLFPAVWTAISTNTGTGGYMEIHDTAGGKSRFYRVSTP